MEDEPVDIASGCDTVTAGSKLGEAALLALISLPKCCDCWAVQQATLLDHSNTQWNQSPFSAPNVRTLDTCNAFGLGRVCIEVAPVNFVLGENDILI